MHALSLKLLIEYGCVSQSFLPFLRQSRLEPCMPGCWRWRAKLLRVSLEMSGLGLLPGVHLRQCWVSWLMSYFGFVCKMKSVSWTNEICEKRKKCMGNLTGVMPFIFFFFFPLFFPFHIFPYECLTHRLHCYFWGYSTSRHRPMLSSPISNCWWGEVRGHPVLNLTFILLHQLPL